MNDEDKALEAMRARAVWSSAILPLTLGIPGRPDLSSYANIELRPGETKTVKGMPQRLFKPQSMQVEPAEPRLLIKRIQSPSRNEANKKAVAEGKHEDYRRPVDPRVSFEPISVNMLREMACLQVCEVVEFDIYNPTQKTLVFTACLHGISVP